MSRKAQITKAINAHGLWKARLQKAISSGTFDKSVEDIRKDNCCEFGQWLYGCELSAEDKNSTYYTQIREIHATFHELAADVVRLATENKQEEAYTKLNGEYKETSIALTRKMMAWMSA